MQNIEQEKHSWIKFSILLTYVLVFALLSILGGSDNSNLNFDNPKTLLILKFFQGITVIIIFILPAFLIAGFWTKTRIHYLGITTKPSLLTILIAASAIVIANPMINWLTEINQHMQLPEAFSGIETWMKNSEERATILTEAFTKGTSKGTLILNLVVIAFLAALSEELFFRGLFQKIAIECFKNKHVGVWFVAIIFSAFHMQFYGFLPRMLMGAYLGYLFLWSGSLWPGILTHFVNNGTYVLYTWLANRGVVTMDVDKIGMEKNQTILVIASSIIVIISMILVYRIEKKRKRLDGFVKS